MSKSKSVFQLTHTPDGFCSHYQCLHITSQLGKDIGCHITFTWWKATRTPGKRPLTSKTEYILILLLREVNEVFIKCMRLKMDTYRNTIHRRKKIILGTLWKSPSLHFYRTQTQTINFNFLRQVTSNRLPSHYKNLRCSTLPNRANPLPHLA